MGSAGEVAEGDPERLIDIPKEVGFERAEVEGGADPEPASAEPSEEEVEEEEPTDDGDDDEDWNA